MKKVLIFLAVLVFLCGCESSQPIYRISEYEDVLGKKLELDKIENITKLQIYEPNEHFEPKNESNYIKLNDIEAKRFKTIIDDFVSSRFNINYSKITIKKIEELNNIISDELKGKICSDYEDFFHIMEKYNVIFYLPYVVMIPGSFVKEFKNDDGQKIIRAFVYIKLICDADEEFYKEYPYIQNGSTYLEIYLYISAESMKITNWVEIYGSEENNLKEIYY